MDHPLAIRHTICSFSNPDFSKMAAAILRLSYAILHEESSLCNENIQIALYNMEAALSSVDGSITSFLIDCSNVTILSKRLVAPVRFSFFKIPTRFCDV